MRRFYASDYEDGRGTQATKPMILFSSVDPVRFSYLRLHINILQTILPTAPQLSWGALGGLELIQCINWLPLETERNRGK